MGSSTGVTSKYMWFLKDALLAAAHRVEELMKIQKKTKTHVPVRWPSMLGAEVLDHEVKDCVVCLVRYTITSKHCMVAFIVDGRQANCNQHPIP